MSDVSAEVRDVLEKATAVTNVVGTRIRRVRARTSDTLPYIVITDADDRPEQHLSGGSNKSSSDVDVACYHTSRGAVRALSTLVYNALNGYKKISGLSEGQVAIHSTIMQRRFPMDTDPTDGSQQGTFKDVCEFTVGYGINETP